MWKLKTYLKRGVVQMNNRKSQLEALLVEVEAGDLHKQKHGGMPLASACYLKDDRGRVIRESWHDANVLRAYNGSLDAAKALHEEVFPYFDWDLDNFTLSGDVCITKLRPLEREYGFSDMNPARAWLIAIIKALIAQEDDAP